MFSKEGFYNRHIDKVLLCICILVLVFTFISIYQGTFLNSVDLHVHLNWIDDYYRAAKIGWLNPSWAYNANYGLGEPALLMLGPVYGIEIILSYVAMGSSFGAVKAFILFNIFLTFCIAVFIAKKEGISRITIVSLIVALNPFLLFLAFRQNAYPWLSSAPFLLLTLYYSYRYYEHESTLISLPLTFSCTLLILTHPLSAFLLFTSVMFGYGLYCTIYFIKNRNFTFNLGRMFKLGINYLLANLLAAFFLMPAIFKMQYINSQVLNNIEEFNYTTAFIVPLVMQFFSQPRWFLINWVFGLLTTVIFIFLIYRYAYNKREKYLLFAGVGGFILASEISFPIWSNFSFIHFVQWPFRYIYIVLFTGMLCFIIKPQNNLIIAKTAMLLLISLSFLIVAQNQKIQPISLKDKLQQEYKGNPAYLPLGINAKLVTEYHQKNNSKPERTLTKEGMTFKYTDEDIKEMGKLSLPLMDHPNWNVYSDGTLVEHFTSKYGTIEIAMPLKSTAIEVKWQSLFEDKVGDLVTFFTLLFLLSVYFYKKTQKTGFENG